MSAPSVSSATPTIPVMFTPRSPSAVATRASEPGPIVELDREPDRHARTSCCAVDGTRRCHGDPADAYAPGHARPARQASRPRRCPTSRSSGATTRRRRARPCASSANDGSSSATSTCASAGSPPPSCAGSSSGSGAAALLDETSRAYRDRRPRLPAPDDAEIVERLLRRPAPAAPPARPPRQRVTAGPDEATWAPGSDRAARPGRRRDHGPDHDEHGPDDRPPDVIVHEAGPGMIPRPWPIQTSPTNSNTAPTIKRPRIAPHGWHASP